MNQLPKTAKNRLRSSEDPGQRSPPKTRKMDRRNPKEMENLSELEKKDVIIDGLQSTVNILQMKIQKLEQLLDLKTKKIQYLEKTMQGS